MRERKKGREEGGGRQWGGGGGGGEGGGEGGGGRGEGRGGGKRITAIALLFLLLLLRVVERDNGWLMEMCSPRVAEAIFLNFSPPHTPIPHKSSPLFDL